MPGVAYLCYGVSCLASAFYDGVCMTLCACMMQGQKRQFGQPGQPTKTALQIYEALTALQQEKAEDPFGWVVPVA